EAITNAVIHRDYRLNHDIHVRIFDTRIEVLSPGLLPGRITPATIHRAKSLARNSLLASNLREFPVPPNVDAGEGVPMMFDVMRANNLYPPLYRELREQVQAAVMVTLLNEERPPIWEQASAWIDLRGPLANSDLCQIASIDTLKASKMLKRWVEQGLLVANTAGGKRNTTYSKPTTELGIGTAGSLSFPPDNEQA
ncbi:MAG: hypothetical protein LBQ09_07155, partial [Acidobacteriaceae bacterium]|nr:hypothetical protein [Acidobacteriaceae bacterium]